MCKDKTPPGRRYRISFSMRTLFVVVTCVAAYLAGHRTGFHAGYTKAAAEYGDEGFHGTYDVSDFVIPLPADMGGKPMLDTGFDRSSSDSNP